MPTEPTRGARTATDPIEDDWKTLRGDLPPRQADAATQPGPAPSLEEPDIDSPDQFALDLRELARELSTSRARLRPLRSQLTFLAIRAGANPADIPDDLWVGYAAEYRDYGTIVGFVPRPEPSSVLGLRLVNILIVLALRAGKATAARDLVLIANEISPEAQ